MTRSRTVEVLSDLISFAKLTKSRLGGSKSTEVQLQASDDDGAEDAAEVWGDAALLSRPVAGAEALFIELGDERVVFATKDRRWQIACEEGEVVLRAMGAGSPAYVHLKPDGSCIIKATSVNLGGGAEKFVALANLVEDAIKNAITKHTHSVTTGSGKTAVGELTGAVSSTAASKVKAE